MQRACLSAALTFLILFSNFRVIDPMKVQAQANYEIKLQGTLVSNWHQYQRPTGELLRAIGVIIESVLYDGNPSLTPPLGSVVKVIDYSPLILCLVPPMIDYVHSGERIEINGMAAWQDNPLLHWYTIISCPHPI